MKKKKLNNTNIEKELAHAFNSDRLSVNLSKIDLKKCKDELEYYSKLKAKDSMVDSSTLMMRFG